MDQLPWWEFARLLKEAFRRRGYSPVETAPAPDSGYDIAMRKRNRLYLVRCKRWAARPVDDRMVREFSAVIEAAGAAGGFVISSGGFTVEAEAFAKRSKLNLIGGTKLRRMIRSAQKRSRRQGGQIHDRNIEPTLTEAPECPKCGNTMVKQIAKRGPKAGEAFWGCSGFPKCYGMLAAD